MLRKWYIELPLVLLTITLAVVYVWNIEPEYSTKQISTQAESSASDTLPHKENAAVAEGKSLFKINCASCHNPAVDGTGPALAGVVERWNEAGKYQGKEGHQWLMLWVRNWRAAVEAGYPYAIQMANSRATEMNIFSNLSDKDIEKILEYVNSPRSVAVSRPQIAQAR